MPPACPRCSAPLPPDAVMCPGCGHSLSDAADEAVTGFLQGGAALDEAATGVAAGRLPRRASSPHPSAVPSGPLAAGRFVPGTLLAGRYRIIGLLGRGGMGEVYRADDLLLAQAVALKFLPADLTRDPDRLARFREEVRTARDVSHPNVCRVYDIAEGGGEHFLSMEYVDGEDLASLLRRIGRLPQDKGVEIARQLCSGLAAAHDRGVLHRDLKPANVMIDGRGHVRLADFGLASVASDLASADLAGTPAYMAPEQFQGKPASVQSDVYALGLVLYEMFTGKPVVSGSTVAELARQHREQAPSSMTAIVAELDPAIERAIQRCLAKEPGERPASALAVSAALPGGDPLAAAIARGETPSPELVAAAGDIGFLKPWTALALLALVVVGLIATSLLYDQVQVTRLVPMPRPPAVLRDRAREVAAALGYRDMPAYTSSGFGYGSYLSYLVERRIYPREQLRKGRPAAVIFWYRESPTPLRTTDFLTGGRATPSDPAAVEPGMLLAVFDPAGRLLRFTAVPDPTPRPATPAAPDWEAVFRAMGLNRAAFAEAPPARVPPVFADTRAAWSGTYPESPDTRIRIEAATLDGRLVYLQIVEPWTKSGARAGTVRGGFNETVVPIVLLTLAGAAILLAVRNARLGRGDRRGAARLAVVLMALVFIRGLAGSDLDPSVASLMVSLFYLLSRALLFAAFLWVCYLALEPYVRRRWPHTLISWSRLLAGRWKDPLIGRDVLAGCGIGVAAQALFALNARLSNGAEAIQAGALDGFRFALAIIVARLSEAIVLSTGIVLGLFLLTLVVRRRWIAVGLVMVFFGLNSVQGDLVASLPQAVITAGVVGVLLLGLLRFGLLTLAASVMMANLAGTLPLAFGTSEWYSGLSYLAVTIILGTALIAFWRATPVRGLVARLLSE